MLSYTWHNSPSLTQYMQFVYCQVGILMWNKTSFCNLAKALYLYIRSLLWWGCEYRGVQLWCTRAVYIENTYSSTTNKLTIKLIQMLCTFSLFPRPFPLILLWDRKHNNGQLAYFAKSTELYWRGPHNSHRSGYSKSRKIETRRWNKTRQNPRPQNYTNSTRVPQRMHFLCNMAHS